MKKGPDAGGLEGAHLEAAMQFTRTHATRAQGRAEEMVALLRHLEAIDVQAEREAAPWEIALLGGAIGFAALFAWMVFGPWLLQISGMAAHSREAFALASRLNRWLVPAFFLTVAIQAAASRKARIARARDLPNELRDLLLPTLETLAAEQGPGTRAELELDLSGPDTETPWARARLGLRSGEVLVLEFQDQAFARAGSADVLRRSVRVELLAPPGTAPAPIPEQLDESDVPASLDGMSWSEVHRGAAVGTALEAWRSYHGDGELLSLETVRDLLDRILPRKEAHGS